MPFCPCDGRWVSLGDLSAGLRYTTPSPRITPTPPATTAPPAMITASATPTRIMSPRPGATVGQKIAVEGILAGLRPDEHVFLCVKSQAFGRLIYPQGQVIPDETGQWTV